MEEEEIARLRRAIHRSYGSSPHKKKYWLALLEKHAKAEPSRVSDSERSTQTWAFNSGRGELKDGKRR